MVVCGVELTGKEAILALVRGSPEGSNHMVCSTKKLKLLDDRDAQSLLTMKSAIEAFAQNNRVHSFAIKSRLATGSRAGGGITFKIETLFQLSGTPVTFISPQTLAKFAKSNLSGVPQSVVGYQTDAYRAGAWLVSNA